MFSRCLSFVRSCLSLILFMSVGGSVFAQGKDDLPSSDPMFRQPSSAYAVWAKTNSPPDQRRAALAYLQALAENLQANPSNTAARAELVKVYMLEKNYDKIVKMCAAQLEFEKEPATLAAVSISLSDAYLAMDDTAKAAQIMEEALEKYAASTNYTSILAKLDALYSNQKEKFLSLCAKRLATERDPRAIYAIASSLSAAYSAVGDNANAIKTLDNCLEQNRSLIPAMDVATAAKRLVYIYVYILDQPASAVSLLDRELTALPSGNAAQQADLLVAKVKILAQDLKDYAGAEDACRKVLELSAQIPAALLIEAYVNLAQVLQITNRPDEAAELILDAVKKITANPSRIIQQLLEIEIGNPPLEEALWILRERIAGQFATNSVVDQYQPDIIRLLIKISKTQEAMQEAYVFLFTCSDKSVPAAVELIALTYKTHDSNLGRANAFLKFQKYGPSGEDGKTGTEDDLTDLMKSVPIMSDERRARLFQVKMNALSTDWTGWKQRGDMLSYMGKIAEAVTAYKKSFELCPMNEKDLQSAADVLVGCVMRIAKDKAIAEALIQFLMFGPAGKDAQVGTADDLKDPTPDILKMVQWSPLPSSRAQSRAITTTAAPNAGQSDSGPMPVSGAVSKIADP